MRWNQVRSPDSGQGLGWINPAHLTTGAKSHYSTYMYCSMTKLEGHSREICYTSAGSHASLQQNQFGRPPANLWSFPSRPKKMGQEIRPKKTILARPSESDIGGWLCSHQCGNEEKKLGQSAPDDDMPTQHATFGRISHPSLPDRHSISVLPWHCDEIHLVPHHGSHWSVLR